MLTAYSTRCPGIYFSLEPAAPFPSVCLVVSTLTARPASLQHGSETMIPPKTFESISFILSLSIQQTSVQPDNHIHTQPSQSQQRCFCIV